LSEDKIVTYKSYSVIFRHLFRAPVWPLYLGYNESNTPHTTIGAVLQGFPSAQPYLRLRPAD
ncbi:hypothetical protein BKA66DRAFT_495799, partial [Pyrenochaeta sp. MPI-SDFR-AT-0127]